MAGQLYPTPKSFQERRDDDIARQKRIEKRRPKFGWLVIPFFGSAAVWLVLRFITALPEMWSRDDMGFLFFTFTMWLGIAGCVIGWIFYTNSRLYAHGKPRTTFWVSYLVALFVLLLLFVTGSLSGVSNGDMITTVAIVHCLLLFCITIVLFSVGNTPWRRS